MAYCPFRNPDVFVTGHRSPKVVSWAAIKVDIKTDRPRFWASWFYPHLLAVFALLATFTLKFLKAGSFRLMRVAGYGAGLFEPHTCRYADTRRCSLLWPCRWRFCLPLSWFPKGQPTGTFYLHGIICLVGSGCPIHYPKTALFVGHRK